MELKIGDSIIFYKRKKGGVYSMLEKIPGRVVRIGRAMVTCDCGPAGIRRALPENLQRVKAVG